MDDLARQLGINTNGVRYEDMTKEERDTFHGWLDDLSKNELTLTKIIEYIHSMRDFVEQELINTPEMERTWLFFQRPNRKAVLLKARLQNYMLLEAFLMTPEKAKKALEQKLKNIW